MNFFYDFFTTQSIPSTVLFLCLTAFVGIAAGKFEIKSVKLGVAGVLFAGILIAHFGAPVDVATLQFVRDFGLILFVYSIGLNMGPRFFSSFKKDGILLNLLTMGIVAGGFLTAYLIRYFTGLSPAVGVGILCGAVTNTPSLGAAQQVLTEQGAAPAVVSQTGMAYAVAYPFGILGIILTFFLIKLLFRISVKGEVKSYTDGLGNSTTELESVEIIVSNPALFGKSIAYVKHLADKELVISRIIRGGESMLASDKEIVYQDDIICGVSAQNLIENLGIKIGKVEIVKTKEIEGPLAMINILMTNKKLSGKTIEQVGIYRRYPANITRIFRKLFVCHQNIYH
jgi:putative transport protein